MKSLHHSMSKMTASAQYWLKHSILIEDHLILQTFTRETSCLYLYDSLKISEKTINSWMLIWTKQHLIRDKDTCRSCARPSTISSSRVVSSERLWFQMRYWGDTYTWVCEYAVTHNFSLFARAPNQWTQLKCGTINTHVISFNCEFFDFFRNPPLRKFKRLFCL